MPEVARRCFIHVLIFTLGGHLCGPAFSSYLKGRFGLDRTRGSLFSMDDAVHTFADHVPIGRIVYRHLKRNGGTHHFGLVITGPLARIQQPWAESGSAI